MKKADKLLIITKIKKTIVYLDNIVDNFPLKETILRDNLKNTIYQLLEIAYRANINVDEKRLIHQRELLVKMKMLDFYIKISCDKKIINYKKYEKIGVHLLMITKLIQAWIKKGLENKDYEEN